jgi:hypothetical protein
MVTTNESGQTEHLYTRIVEVAHKIHKESNSIPREVFPTTAKPEGVPGEHPIILFLLCGMFLAEVWGGITALLRVAMRVGMHDESLTTPSRTL